ncbi:hypothetical protein [Celeribacter persicus]|uniref:Uncharacterized protein n=1 Tax=Celeribacter persicus TaxID=1651082 RepID=A0A2T5HBG6_9RHOB|nr:hypothetical protein [Celeribacter persicus]PTQ68906.1 hypothetical protein C8N42_11349 [Celeribacter persicus]
MDGIVLWADPQAHKAVIWCSDHGPLAYATGPETLIGAFDMPEAGTMVYCETHMENGVRICTQLHPIQRFAAPELAEALRALAAEASAA